MLKRVKIQGYKSLVDVEVHLQPLSVLFGPNASGKSNFLDALQLLSRIATERNLKYAFDPPYRGTPLESFTFGLSGINDLLTQEKSSFSMEVDVELSQTTVDAVNRQIRLLRRLGAKGDAASKDTDQTSPLDNPSLVNRRNLRYYISIETTPKTGTLIVAGEYLAVLNAKGEITEEPLLLERDYGFLKFGEKSYQFFEELDYSTLSIPNFFSSFLFFQYLLAMREEIASWLFFYLEPRERMRLPTSVKEVRHIGLMGEELAAFLNTLRELDEPQFKAVEKALHMIIPSITGIDVNVNNVGEVELRLMQDQTPIPARVLSEGTLRILGLLALGGAKEPATLLGFEEPENGIHPDRLDLVASLLTNLTSGDTQVIVTTHSPTLLDLLPEESLYVFGLSDGNTTITPFSTLKKTKHRKSKLSEDLTVSERLLRGDFHA